MEIQWLQAVIDLPPEHHERAGDFWVSITASGRGDVHPDHTEYMHLHPRTGDVHLELQRLDEGPPAAHLDLLVSDISAWTARAVELGAALVAQPGHDVLSTPGGVPFCIVPHGTEATRAEVIDPAVPHAVDQICLDVPHEYFEADVAFWSALTGWAVNPAQLPEFRSFDQPANLPLRLLVQQLGLDDEGGPRAHLDVSSGDHVAELTDRHVAAGATVVERRRYWTALHDPAGMPYCITGRAPSNG